MREILFRGKRTDNGEWVEGRNIHIVKNESGKRMYIAQTDTPCGIFESEEHSGAFMSFPVFRVIPETVGQYTGLTDKNGKNGKKIFEGDIVKHFDNSNDDYDIGEIYFDTDFVGWRRTTTHKFHNKTLISTYKINPTCIYEVIGNIHDNPELLKG